MVSARVIQKDLAILKAAGIEVPAAIENYVDAEELRSRGVKEVWGCSKCNHRFESEVRIQSSTHRCSASKSKEPLLLKKVWTS